LYNKQKAIDDYKDCAEAISNGTVDIPNKHCKAEKNLFLASKAFSAGGIIAAATINQSRPDLFQAMTLINPFLDVLGTMSMMTKGDGREESEHFLTDHEWDEFGNPISDTQACSTITQYCPIFNIKKGQSYPPMFIVSTVDDENVPYYNNGKQYVNKIRAAMKETKNDIPILLNIEAMGGHHLHGRILDVSILENCFLLGQLHCTR